MLLQGPCIRKRLQGPESGSKTPGKEALARAERGARGNGSADAVPGPHEEQCIRNALVTRVKNQIKLCIWE